MSLQLVSSRPVIRLHTIQQWFSVAPEIRQVVLANLKIKERLWTYLRAKIIKPARTEAKWVQCSKCKDSEHPGWVLLEPRYPGIHPSQFGSPCLLKIWNEMKGVERRETHEARSQLIFDFGSSLHHVFQGYGEDGAWGPQYSKESTVSGEFQEIAKELMLEGSADAENILIIDDIPNSPIFEVGLIHEYKSMKQELFQKLTRPKPEHRSQAMLYSAALNRPVVVYLYMNKNDSDLKDYPIPFVSEEWATMESKARLLVQHHRAGTPPPATTGFHCKDCGYAYNCEPYQATNRR